MFKIGEPVPEYEHQYLHGVKDLGERIQYMNRRMADAAIEAILDGVWIPKVV